VAAGKGLGEGGDAFREGQGLLVDFQLLKEKRDVPSEDAGLTRAADSNDLSGER